MISGNLDPPSASRLLIILADAASPALSVVDKNIQNRLGQRLTAHQYSLPLSYSQSAFLRLHVQLATSSSKSKHIQLTIFQFCLQESHERYYQLFW